MALWQLRSGNLSWEEGTSDNDDTVSSLHGKSLIKSYQSFKFWKTCSMSCDRDNRKRRGEVAKYLQPTRRPSECKQMAAQWILSFFSLSQLSTDDDSLKRYIWLLLMLHFTWHISQERERDREPVASFRGLHY